MQTCGEFGKRHYRPLFARPVKLRSLHDRVKPQGSIAASLRTTPAPVTRVLFMLGRRWRLPILFGLFAEPSTRTSQLLRDTPGISQKMLTQHLGELEADGLIARQDFGDSRHGMNTA
ncbi:Hypothetical protein NGAL_HAMBI1146_08760 [Neorhizobium galegae bv. officinalis]|nr:Hypothetical protein NGAL_HAMBI490_46940 [Neorhizobium galegae bv. officinalis]CDZ34445.1 Hypothetical protein NGAL_HAMBI1146_08760 [Neorhizobium galegae bv. officinalis]